LLCLVQSGQDLFDLDGEPGELRRHEGQLLSMAFQLRVQRGIVGAFVGTLGIAPAHDMLCRAGMAMDELQSIITTRTPEGKVLTFTPAICHNGYTFSLYWRACNTLTHLALGTRQGHCCFYACSRLALCAAFRRAMSSSSALGTSRCSV